MELIRAYLIDKFVVGQIYWVECADHNYSGTYIGNRSVFGDMAHEFQDTVQYKRDSKERMLQSNVLLFPEEINLIRRRSFAR
ncbi:hypothetical protein GZH47_32990 (plasmid) [Paenibacillus rhizovicinus]|uniref:Uncharacterized protein n=1 Tax=Paenibacillus rhizovicinus TaxID=2704463 RepID=A0A6C0PBE4_9BACL|nr:hypothetical protein [Paenibacillus rhizovicinus]QHW35711.1 hypothetical protein GZH47_32990 [Paenibacillus rhizovicinus]